MSCYHYVKIILVSQFNFDILASQYYGIIVQPFNGTLVTILIWYSVTIKCDKIVSQCQGNIVSQYQINIV